MAFLLERVRRDLVGQPDATSLLVEVDDDAGAAALDELHGELELLAAVTLERAQHLGGEALVVHSNREVAGAAHVPDEDGHGLAVVPLVAVRADAKIPTLCGEEGLGDEAHRSRFWICDATVGRGHMGLQ